MINITINNKIINLGGKFEYEKSFKIRKNKPKLTTLAFTLIELLAIIIILAIIAVITVPIILSVTENSRKGTAKDSIIGYAKSLEYALTKYESEIVPDDSVNIDTDSSRVVQTITIKDDNGQTYTKNIGINYEGDEVTGCKAKVEAGKLTLKNCKVNSYSTTQKFNYADGKVTLKQGSSSTPSFQADSWDDIVENLEDDREYYPIGSEKTIAMDIDGNGTDETYTLRLVNRESCDSNWVGSETACGVVLEFVDVIAEHEFNGTSTSYTNFGGWPATNTTNPLYTYVNDTLYNKLPSELKSIIINTKSITGHGSNATFNFESIDKLYLLTSGEIGAKNDYDTVELAASNDNVGTGKTKTLEYYTNSSNSRIKNYNGSGNLYWLRSASSSNFPGRFLTVSPYENGNVGEANACSSRGVAPAFRILP